MTTNRMGLEQTLSDEHVIREYRTSSSVWIQCSKQAYDRSKAEGFEVRELYEQPQIQPQNIPEIIPVTCNWSPDDNGVWGGTCGITWQFFDDGPAENGAKFCPGCGGLIAVGESVTNEP